MEYNNWYEQYQQSRGNTSAEPEKTAKKEKKGVTVTALIACMLVTALLGGVLGGGFTYLATRKTAQTASAEAAQTQAAQQAPAFATAPVPDEKSSATVVPDKDIPNKDEAASKAQDSAPASTSAAVSGSTPSFMTASGTVPSISKAQIVEACAPSVVGIDIEYTVSSSNYGGYGYYYYFGNGGYPSGSQTEQASGSGVIVTTDGYIVTCNHVVSDATSIKVILNDESEYDATVVGTDERNDLAVIKINASGLVPATLGDSDMLTVGEDVVAIGNPLGELRGTATGGMVSALGRAVNVENTDMTLIQHDAAVSPGSSGGGLFNSSGSLIGIVNAKASSDNAEGIGFAIPVNDVKGIISDLIEHGYVTGRAYLGVLTQNVTLRSDRGGWGGYFGSSGTSCVQVAQVISGGAAEAAGICAGDLILAIGDTAVTSTDVLSSEIGKYDAGDQALITISHNGQQSEVTVTFGEYAPEKDNN